MSPDSTIAQSPLPSQGQRRPVSWRSILLGLLGVCFICALTAFNDYVVNNTYMVGNFLPVGLVMFFLVLIFAVNAPLWKFFPRLAFNRGELAVALGMTLVSCALPSSGLMRYLPAHLVMYQQRAHDDPAVAKLLDDLHLPDWMFPHFQHKESALRGSEPVVENFGGHVYVDAAHDNFRGHLRVVPWRLWLMPAMTWGVFLFGLYGLMLCISIVIRHQWVENERLAFPLATVYLALIDQPAPGRALNPLFRSSKFWIAFGTVFLIHFINGLNQYSPNTWPRIPVGFTMVDILNTQIWSYSDWGFRDGHIYFCIIGICFFLQTKVAFSLWFTYVALSLARMAAGNMQVEYTPGMRTDELFGACLPFILAVIWVGRAHWALVIKQMFRAPRGDETTGRYLPYFLAGWGSVLCAMVMIGWLMAVGASLAGAIVLVLMLTMCLMIVTRIVAETGLIFVQLPLPLNRPWIHLAQDLPGRIIARTTERSYFMTSMMNIIFAHDMRECLPVFATHALRVADSAAYEGERNWRKAIPFTASLVLALVVGYAVSGASMLYTEYTYAATLDRRPQTPINNYGVINSVNDSLTPTLQYLPPAAGMIENHNRLAHFAGGAVVCTILSVLRLRYINWPLNPVGLLLSTSYPMSMCWFSIFVGWLAKLIIVRFCGSRGFHAARNLFIGMIVGEAAAAAFWLVISLIRLSMGLQFNAIKLLPA